MNPEDRGNSPAGPDPFEPPTPSLLGVFLAYPAQLYVGLHFPFFYAFAQAMRLITWPPAALVGALTGRRARDVQPYLLFRAIVRSARYTNFMRPENVERWNHELEAGTPRERRALRVFPLLFLSDLSATSFVNVVLLRAPFRLEPVDRKQLAVRVIPDGEPLSGGERALILCFLGLLPAAIVLSIVMESVAAP